MTPEEQAHQLRQYQQWLADAQMLASSLSAQLATRNARITELEAAAAPKPGPAKEPADA